jgi:hypothetical protein
VDDLKISSKDHRSVDIVIEYLTKVYKKINAHDDKVLDYLGMIFDYSEDGKVKIHMKDMIEEIVRDMDIEDSQVCPTPAANYLFTVSEESPTLNESQSEKFHSCVAKLLYLAKRARPDILTSISFLTTRVTCSTEEDWKKLMRVCRYLNGTKHLKLVLSCDDRIKVVSHIDSSYGIHPDMKGHTGNTISLGRGSVVNGSTKQKLVAKSSSESELIGLSDKVTPVLWTIQFLEAQGHKVKPATVFQDNKSTIMLANKGRSTSHRTRHIAIKYFFIKDHIENEDINVVYVGTDNMVADFFTKPLQGAMFKKHRLSIMNDE